MIEIIAEIGINHNGSIQTAIELMTVAKEAGCNYAKFQKRTPELCVPEHQKSVMRQTPWGEMTYLEYKKRIEFSALSYSMFRNHSLPIFASVWDEPSVLFIRKVLNPEYYKIPSALLTNTELLKTAASTGKTIILSTGMSTEQEIDKAMRHLTGVPVILMHSVSCYPLNDEDANLNAIETLKEYGAPVGYSDHTKGIHMATAAAAMGVCMIEKHITLDRTMWGTDQSASLEPAGLKKMVRNIRAVESGMGSGTKIEIQECEQTAKDRLRP